MLQSGPCNLLEEKEQDEKGFRMAQVLLLRLELYIAQARQCSRLGPVIYLKKKKEKKALEWLKPLMSYVTLSARTRMKSSPVMPKNDNFASRALTGEEQSLSYS